MGKTQFLFSGLCRVNPKEGFTKKAFLENENEERGGFKKILS